MKERNRAQRHSTGEARFSHGFFDCLFFNPRIPRSPTAYSVDAFLCKFRAESMPYDCGGRLPRIHGFFSPWSVRKPGSAVFPACFSRSAAQVHQTAGTVRQSASMLPRQNRPTTRARRRPGRSWRSHENPCAKRSPQAGRGLRSTCPRAGSRYDAGSIGGDRSRFPGTGREKGRACINKRAVGPISGLAVDSERLGLLTPRPGRPQGGGAAARRGNR